MTKCSQKLTKLFWWSAQMMQPLGLRRGYSAQSSNLTPQQIELMARSLPKRKQLDGVADIVVVASGKGGVGKSTTSVNLAVTLAQMGKRIGLLDADVFGPSIPLMMNISEEPLINDQNFMIPPVNYGVKCSSMGLLIDERKPIVWRGPLVMSALQRLLKGTAWGTLDILIVDTPPGTGDIHLSLAQNVPISGVLLVSTPQAAAIEVTRRGAEMYKESLKIPIIGLVENMRYINCSKCGERNELFGNVTEKFCTDMKCSILASVAINPSITESCDAGVPLVIKQPNSEYARTFQQLGVKVIEFLAK